MQGFGSGAFSDFNGLDTRSETERRADYLHRVDLVKLGLAGNLKDYTLTTYDGQTVKGSQLDYNGQGAGFASQPAENVNYVDAHDNETLFDLVTYKMPADAPMEHRVRMSLISQASVHWLSRPRSGRRAQRRCARSPWIVIPSTPVITSTRLTGR